MKNKVARFLLLLVGALPGMACAAPTTVAIPGQGWQVSFDAPPLAERKEADHPEQYMFFGTAGRFNVSIYVEPPGCNRGATHADFIDCFWPRASRNPVIVRESIRKTCTDAYCRIGYDIKAPWNGRLSRQANIHFLFAYQGRWTDVQVSVVEPTDDDLKLLELFETSLAYGVTP